MLTQTTRLALWLSGIESACSAGQVGDMGLIPGLGRSPGEGNGNPLQYSYQENPMDRGTWRAKVHGVAELDTTEELSVSITQTNSLPPRRSYSLTVLVSLRLCSHLKPLHPLQPQAFNFPLVFFLHPPLPLISWHKAIACHSFFTDSSQV